MNKPTTYMCVNCPRVSEGAIRNALPQHATMLSTTNEEFKRFRFFRSGDAEPPLGGAGAGTSEPVQENSDDLSAAKDKVAMLLLKPSPSPVSAAVKETVQPSQAGQSPVAEPDCILYHIVNDDWADAEMLRLIQRKCAFRDIPVIALSSFRDSPRARKLLPLGVDDLLLFPSQADEIRKKLMGVLKPAGSHTPMTAAIINPYIGAVTDMLTTMAGMRAEKKSVFLKKNYRLFGDIAAVMPFTGNMVGEVAICFEEALARTIVSRILSEKPEDLTKDDLRDGVGELINIISGNAKASLSMTAYRHQITLPIVVVGQNRELSHPRNAPCIVILFDVAAQPMAVQVTMASVDGTDKKESRPHDR
jgi:chemotaxis protein CheX